MDTNQSESKAVKKFETLDDVMDVMSRVINKDLIVEAVTIMVLREMVAEPEYFHISEFWVGQGNEAGFLKMIRNAVLKAVKNNPEYDDYTLCGVACQTLRNDWSVETPVEPSKEIDPVEERLQKHLSDDSFTPSQLGSFEMLNFDTRQWRILLGNVSQRNLFKHMDHAYFTELWFRREAIMDSIETIDISDQWIDQAPTDYLKEVLSQRRDEISAYEKDLYNNVESFAEHLLKVREELMDYKEPVDLDVERPKVIKMVCAHIASSESNGFDVNYKNCSYLKSKGFNCGVGEKDSFGPVTLYLDIVEDIATVVI